MVQLMSKFTTCVSFSRVCFSIFFEVLVRSCVPHVSYEISCCSRVLDSLNCLQDNLMCLIMRSKKNEHDIPLECTHD